MPQRKTKRYFRLVLVVSFLILMLRLGLETHEFYEHLSAFTRIVIFLSLEGTLVVGVTGLMYHHNRFNQIVEEAHRVELRRKVEEAEKAKKAAVELSHALNASLHARDEFLATVSHEMRTPMASIKGWSQMLQWDNVDPCMLKQGLKAIEECSVAQTQLIEDLLDLSRIQRGTLSVNPVPVDVRETVQAAVNKIAPIILQRGLKLNIDMPPDPVYAYIDPMRFHQIIWNLLTNSAKFTSRGVISVTVRTEGSNVLASVSDTGKGMNEEQLNHLFDRFYKVSHYDTAHHSGGLGLGLSIVKYLVELHAGDVMADSEGEGKGSKFTVSLPVI